MRSSQHRHRLEVPMPRFNELMVPERVQPFWAALQRGEFINDAAAEAGTYRKKGTRWVAACGGVRPRRGRPPDRRYRRRPNGLRLSDDRAALLYCPDENLALAG
jgi:hypothetical protein